MHHNTGPSALSPIIDLCFEYLQPPILDLNIKNTCVVLHLSTARDRYYIYIFSGIKIYIKNKKMSTIFGNIQQRHSFSLRCSVAVTKQ